MGGYSLYSHVGGSNLKTLCQAGYYRCCTSMCSWTPSICSSHEYPSTPCAYTYTHTHTHTHARPREVAKD